MEEVYIKGLPSLLFMQAVDYTMSHDANNYVLEIPRKGSYKDIAPEYFKDEDGEFNVFDDEKKVLYIPSLTKILLACNKYPQLDSNQVAVPITIKLLEDKIEIVYNVLSMVNVIDGDYEDEMPAV